MKKNYYFSYSKLRLKFKRFKNKSSNLKIEEEFIDNSLEMTMTVQTIKYIRKYLTIYKLDFDIIENINTDFVYLKFIVNRV